MISNGAKIAFWKILDRNVEETPKIILYTDSATHNSMTAKIEDITLTKSMEVLQNEAEQQIAELNADKEIHIINYHYFIWVQIQS